MSKLDKALIRELAADRRETRRVFASLEGAIRRATRRVALAAAVLGAICLGAIVWVGLRQPVTVVVHQVRQPPPPSEPRSHCIPFPELGFVCGPGDTFPEPE